MRNNRVFYFCRILIFCTLFPIFSAHSLEKEQVAVDQRLNIKNWKTESGSSVFFVNSQRLPMIDIMIDVDAGSRWDPAGLEGLASLVAGMLLKGHHLERKIVSEEEVGEFFVQNSIVRSVSTSRDKVSISLRFFFLSFRLSSLLLFFFCSCYYIGVCISQDGSNSVSSESLRFCALA